jgi:hypothetical protein
MSGDCNLAGPNVEAPSPEPRGPRWFLLPKAFCRLSLRESSDQTALLSRSERRQSRQRALSATETNWPHPAICDALRHELPPAAGRSSSALRREGLHPSDLFMMRAIYLAYPIFDAVRQELSWGAQVLGEIKNVLAEAGR